MTKDEEKEVIRVCGPDYEHLDIPAFRRRGSRIRLSSEAGGSQCIVIKIMKKARKQLKGRHLNKVIAKVVRY